MPAQMFFVIATPAFVLGGLCMYLLLDLIQHLKA
jgi:hypothetical protein